MRTRTALGGLVVGIVCALVLYGLRQAGYQSLVYTVSVTLLIVAAAAMICRRLA